jgi:ParB/RepB/Spo0J family partition protein
MTALPAPSTQPAAQAPALFFLAPKEIKEHPDNPRQVVTADEELVDSVRAVGVLEPLVVAPPHSGIPARSMHGATWVLIAGHRRLAAAKAAGLDTVPAIARTDLTSRAAQVEAMLVENLHRADLTPVEEGDAYQLLLDLPGSTQASVARQVGQPVKRIRERIKLAKLSEQVRAKLQTHQVTIADALAIGEFDDDAKTQKDLLARVGDTNFDWAVSRARADRQLRADTATATEQLAAAGVKVLTKPPAGARKIANPIPRLLLIQAASAVVLPVRDARRTESAPLVTPPTGAHVEVSLIAAPTKSVHRSGARGIRRPLPPDGWAGWLRRKTSGALDLEWVRADPAGVRSGRRSGRRITFTRVAYHATGTVTDAAALSTLQRIGVGTGKGYGCGLLLVREVTP